MFIEVSEPYDLQIIGDFRSDVSSALLNGGTESRGNTA